jgi:WD40 repeat protein
MNKKEEINTSSIILKNEINNTINNKSYFENIFKMEEYSFNHSDTIYDIIIIDNHLIACSKDALITVYNLDNFEEDYKIREHKEQIKILAKLRDNTLVSCDLNIIFIKFNKNYGYKIIQIIQKAHSESINKLIELNNGNIMTCAEDKLIKIWNNDGGLFNISTIINVHKLSINSLLQTTNTEFVSSSSNENKIYFWDLNLRNIICILDNIVCSLNSNSLYKLSKEYFIVGGLLNNYIIDIKKRKVFQKINTHSFYFFNSFLKLNENLFLQGNDFGEIIVWNINSDKNNKKEWNIQFKKKIHDFGINNIIKYKNYIITCSYDKTVKIFKLN